MYLCFAYQTMSPSIFPWILPNMFLSLSLCFFSLLFKVTHFKLFCQHVCKYKAIQWNMGNLPGAIHWRRFSLCQHSPAAYSCSVRCGVSRAPVMPVLEFCLHGFISMSYPENSISQHSLLPLQLTHSFFLLFVVFPDPC